MDLLAPDGCVHDRPVYIGFDALKTGRILDKALSRVLDLHGNDAQRFTPVLHERLVQCNSAAPKRKGPDSGCRSLLVTSLGYVYYCHHAVTLLQESYLATGKV